MSELVTVGKTHCQGHQDPSKSVSIFLRETEANVKMVFIYAVFISRSRTVNAAFCSHGSLDTGHAPLQLRLRACFCRSSFRKLTSRLSLRAFGPLEGVVAFGLFKFCILSLPDLGLWRVCFPPCLVRPGRRLPVQGLSEGSLGYLDRLPA